MHAISPFQAFRVHRFSRFRARFRLAQRKLARPGRVRCVALSSDATVVVAGGFDKLVPHINAASSPTPALHISLFRCLPFKLTFTVGS
eukprot:4045709-Pleurochrysis_carterae.AAC.1